MSRKRKTVQQMNDEEQYRSRPSRRMVRTERRKVNPVMAPGPQAIADDDYVGVGCEECGMLNKWRAKSPPLTHCVCCRSLLPEYIDDAV